MPEELRAGSKVRYKRGTTVAVFQLKLIRNPPKGDPIHWNYDRAELIADGMMHVLGVSLGIVALALFIGTDRYDIAIYTIVLLTMFGLSATYNLWPVSPRKWLLRRFGTKSRGVLRAA